MFVTEIWHGARLAANVEYRENGVIISTEDPNLCHRLPEIYGSDMELGEYLRRNYELNRLRTEGYTWELKLARERDDMFLLTR